LKPRLGSLRLIVRLRGRSHTSRPQADGRRNTLEARFQSPALVALPAVFCYTLHSNKRVEISISVAGVRE